MSVRITILGCGSSAGVPRLGGGWGACDPSNPKNRRRRCSLLVQRTGAGGITNVLIDTSPDLREQLLDVGIAHLDAVLYTHAHADHTHGIDDLRALTQHMRRRIPVYMDEPTAAHVRHRFAYCFETPAGSDYPPILDDHRISHGDEIAIEGAGGALNFQAFDQIHTPGISLGFRIGNVAYSTDLNDIPEKSLPFLRGLDVWIVDCLRPKPHPSHFCLSQTLEWIARIEPEHSILTDLHSDFDYDELKSLLPRGIEPAYDGMQIDLLI